MDVNSESDSRVNIDNEKNSSISNNLNFINLLQGSVSLNNHINVHASCFQRPPDINDHVEMHVLNTLSGHFDYETSLHDSMVSQCNHSNQSYDRSLTLDTFSNENLPPTQQTHQVSEAKVSPLYKNGPHEDVNNYRPISILPVLSKVLEKHVHDCLSAYLNNHNLLHKTQSGFRPQHSCETALVHMIDSWFHKVPF